MVVDTQEAWSETARAGRGIPLTDSARPSRLAAPPSTPDIEHLLNTRTPLIRTGFYAVSLVALLSIGSCGPKRLAVVGPLDNPATEAASAERGTRLEEPVRIDFTWQLNEAGSRVSGAGVARIEPPHHARLDLFLDNGESVVSAALVDEELRLPRGAPDDVLPPVELMWSTLGVFRPMAGTVLVGGDRLEGGVTRLRYRHENGAEFHYEVSDGSVRGLELLDGGSVLQWVRLSLSEADRYPQTATYRNLVEYRELRIERSQLRPAESFDPAIWDPRAP